jgi:hypothetical protein
MLGITVMSLTLPTSSQIYECYEINICWHVTGGTVIYSLLNSHLPDPELQNTTLFKVERETRNVIQV